MSLTFRHQHHGPKLGGLQNAFHLQARKRLPALAKRLGGACPLLLHQIVQALTLLRLSDADPAPRLHEADAGRPVRRAQQPHQHVGLHATAGKVAHVAPQFHGAIDRRARSGVKGVFGNLGLRMG